MRVLVVGGGGREHAMVWRLAQNPSVDRLYAAPGNAGIASEATCLPIAADDVPAIVAAVDRESIDLTIVGPEAPLVAGLADELGGPWSPGLRADPRGRADRGVEGVGQGAVRSARDPGGAVADVHDAVGPRWSTSTSWGPARWWSRRTAWRPARA